MLKFTKTVICAENCLFMCVAQHIIESWRDSGNAGATSTTINEGFAVSSNTSTSCVCTACGKSFISKPGLRQHIQLIHTPKHIECGGADGSCTKMFAYAYQLHQHQRTAHTTNIFYCPVARCGKRYTAIGSLNSHTATQHGDTNLQCDHPNCSQVG